jgi:hypothetical protein
MDTIGVGFSTAKNPLKAAQEASSIALSRIRGQVCRSCMVFSSVGYPQDVLLGEIRRNVGEVPMVGCSGEGVIVPGATDESNHCVAILVMADERIRLDTAGHPDVAPSREAGRVMGQALAGMRSADTRCVLLFPCGLNVVMDELVPEMERHLGRDIPIIGGLSADNLLRDRTFQYHDWRIYEGGVSGALLSGDFDLVTDVSHGCVPIGLEMEVTRVHANRIYEIDGRPVVDVLQEYVGNRLIRDFGKVSLHFCIGQPADPELTETYDRYIIRYMAKYHDEDGSISLPVTMKEGDKIWVTRRDRDKMFSACQRGISVVRETLGGRKPFLVLDFNCVGRGKIVLAESEKYDLLHMSQDGLAQGVPWMGFYTYGELCPVGGRNVFHNYTDVFALLVWR